MHQQENQGLKLPHIARGCTAASSVWLSASSPTSRFIEESRENAPFSSGKNEHAHLVLVCVCTHPHKHTQMPAGGGLACKAGRQFYLLNGSVPDWCFCIGFFHFYNQDNVWQPAYLKRLLCSQLLSAQKCEGLGGERLDTLLNKWTGLDLTFKKNYFFYWKLFPKAFLNTSDWDILHTQFTLLGYNIFSGTHSWESS